MGVDPIRAVELFESFVKRGDLRNARIGLVEDALEWASLLSEEIRAALGIKVVRIPLESLRRPTQSARMKNVGLLATTDLHFNEVRKLTAGMNRPVLQIKLHPDLVPSMRRAAERGSLLLVVARAAGMDAFLSSLSAAGLSDEARNRIRILVPEDPQRLRQMVVEADMIYVSPLAPDWVERHIPTRTRRIRLDRHLTRDSVHLIEAALLFGTRLEIDH